MGETTTIQVTTEQRDELAARKTYDDEPLKAVIGRLLASSGDMGNGPVTLEASEYARIADEVEGRMR
jgi:hypothetical protein